MSWLCFACVAWHNRFQPKGIISTRMDNDSLIVPTRWIAWFSIRQRKILLRNPKRKIPARILWPQRRQLRLRLTRTSSGIHAWISKIRLSWRMQSADLLRLPQTLLSRILTVRFGTWLSSSLCRKVARLPRPLTPAFGATLSATYNVVFLRCAKASIKCVATIWPT